MRIFLFLIILSTSLYAQSFKMTQYDWGDGIEYKWTINDADSGTTSGDIINLSEFNDDFANYPLGYWLDITDADTNVIIKVEMQGKFTGGAWSVVETVLAADTLNAAHADYTDLIGVIDLDYASYKCPQYRPLITITSADGKTCDVQFNVFAYKRD